MREIFLAVLFFICSFNGIASEREASVPSTRPQWIWATAERSVPQQIELRKGFRVDAPVQRADLRLAAEFTRCELNLGGRKILELDDYGPWLDLDVTQQLRSGEDWIELRCVSSVGPSAILFELAITTVDGRRQVLHSGSDWQARLISDDEDVPWHAAKTFGVVAPEYWDADRTARITPFDNYEQWRQASDAGSMTSPTKIVTRPGFEVELLREARDDEGSWISLAFDPQGRLTISREDAGLIRMTLSVDGDSIESVESIDDTLQECRGLVYAYGALFAQANNSKGLFRLRDGDGDGRFESVQRLREFPGGVGHGRNDLTLGPDGAIYAIFGDSVELPTLDVIDHTSPFREARRGQRTTEGHLLRFVPQTNQWHLISSGLRNPYGIDFNEDGEAFTYDADAEFDMGAPWYRPTRLVHLVSGGDYGWRGRTKSWPPYDADHADFTLPSADIGKGSPTALKSGQRSSFPEHYRRAMFALDWAYGRILACHLLPRGAGYVCRAETFLQGRPLNVTDLDFGPDGNLYLITGGRKTHSSLYRVRWTGAEPALSEPTPQQVARREFARSERELRKQLSSLGDDGRTPPPIPLIWKHLGSADPLLRDAARRSLEHHGIESWIELALAETRPSWVIPLMMAVARSDREQYVPHVLGKLADVSQVSLSPYERSMLLETWSRCLSKENAKQSPAFGATVKRIDDWYPDRSPLVFAPVGAGRSVNHQLALLVESLNLPDLVPKTLTLLSQARTQEERIHALFVVRNGRHGWTPDARRIVFETLGELDRSAIGGEGMPGFLGQLREELVATLSEAERVLLGDLVLPGTERDLPPMTVDRPVVKHWTADDLAELLRGIDRQGDVNRGRGLFQTALCDRCHRVGSRGGVSGPDLTSVANRFSRQDILLSIIEPSRVVDEKYQMQQIVTVDGRVVVGRMLTGGDYRSTKLRLQTDPLRPADSVEIEKSEIETYQPSLRSPMPEGLLDTLAAEEILDLITFLEESAIGNLER